MGDVIDIKTGKPVPASKNRSKRFLKSVGKVVGGVAAVAAISAPIIASYEQNKDEVAAYHGDPKLCLPETTEKAPSSKDGGTLSEMSEKKLLELQSAAKGKSLDVGSPTGAEVKGYTDTNLELNGLNELHQQLEKDTAYKLGKVCIVVSDQTGKPEYISVRTQ
jgi:hypothetical protein